MFSPAERSFLRSTIENSAGAFPSRLESQFPNPAYRRKLMWGIRQKAGRSFADWQLYLQAAQREPRILPRATSSDATSAPLFADPLVTLFQELRRRLSRRPRSSGDRSLREE